MHFCTDKGYEWHDIHTLKPLHILVNNGCIRTNRFYLERTFFLCFRSDLSPSGALRLSTTGVAFAEAFVSIRLFPVPIGSYCSTVYRIEKCSHNTNREAVLKLLLR